MKMTGICYKIPAWSFLSGSSTCSNIIQLKRKKKANRQMTGFSIYPIMCYKICQYGAFSHKVERDDWSSHTACLHKVLNYIPGLGSRRFFLPTTDEDSKSLHLPLEKSVEHSLKSPSSARPPHHGHGWWMLWQLLANCWLCDCSPNHHH